MKKIIGHKQVTEVINVPVPVLLKIILDMGITIIHTYSMKTAISIPEDIFQEVEKYAAEHECSRSEVFVRAVTDFFEKKRNEKLLRTINEVYSVPENKEDIKARRASRIHFRKTVLDKEPSY